MAILKEKHIHKRILLHRMAALLFVFVQLFVLTFQVFLHQGCEAECGRNQGSKLSFTKGSMYCCVCDQLQHQASPDKVSSFFEMEIPVARATVHMDSYCLSYYKFAAPGYTNKGPPVLSLSA